MRKISVIITTKNEEKVLGDLLESIKRQSTWDYETVLVDNFSTDKTVEIAKKYGARVFQKGPERSVQRNFGVEKAIGDYVLILDADMQLTSDVLTDGLKKFESSSYGALVIPEKSIGVGFWAKVKAFERSFYIGDSSIEAARFFRKDVFQKFGGYDTSITGPEDYDLPYRIKKAGVKVGRIKSFILHNEGKFSPIKSARKKFYYASKARIYLKKHPELLSSQGNMLFRPVFIKKWRKLVKHPFLASCMFILKGLEMVAAALGFLYGLRPLR